jgi:phospholipid N-methyltransferase
MNQTLTYLKSFFKDKGVASVTPTSRYCLRRVCKPIDFSRDITIVEYGAGAGVFADYLLPKMTRDSSLIMFETNEHMFRELQKIKDKRVTIHHKSVEFADEMIGENLNGHIDYIISGIPFSFLNEKIRLNILKKSKHILRQVGQFLAYQTSGQLKKPLHSVFGNVHTEWEWRNVPPMTVYRAVKE